MTYEEALRFIHSVDWKGSRPGLERISVLCERLGHPENDLKFVHIAGTNGKGSVSAMLDSILRAAGYRTGLFTSPYIERFNERIRFDGEDIADSALADAAETVMEASRDMEDSPTEFELITAIAFVYYKKIGCDLAVFECASAGGWIPRMSSRPPSSRSSPGSRWTTAPSSETPPKPSPRRKPGS